MKTYVLTVSQFFPATHPRKGDSTGFATGIIEGSKIHTIRGNVDLWSKRADKINKGQAVLSVRVWTGKPYKSKQHEFAEFTSIGIQTIQRDFLGWWIDTYDSDVSTDTIAKNDGLSRKDFADWFKKEKWDDHKVIIHFTDFRY